VLLLGVVPVISTALVSKRKGKNQKLIAGIIRRYAEKGGSMFRGNVVDTDEEILKVAEEHAVLS
jgi:hypothetical protein